MYKYSLWIRSAPPFLCGHLWRGKTTITTANNNDNNDTNTTYSNHSNYYYHCHMAWRDLPGAYVLISYTVREMVASTHAIRRQTEVKQSRYMVL